MYVASYNHVDAAIITIMIRVEVTLSTHMYVITATR